jgi:hypothetical protein
MHGKHNARSLILDSLKSHKSNTLMAQYAQMVGAICLDKAVDQDGNPAPVTFTVRQIPNGREWWQQGTIAHSRDCSTIQEAIERLHCLFGLEMDERGYTYCERGSQNPFTVGMPTMYDVFEGEDGYYKSEDWFDDRCDYPADDYPLLASEWVARGIASYAYDNYSLKIVASSGNIVY